jgi:putative ABC transport system permease protein
VDLAPALALLCLSWAVLGAVGLLAAVRPIPRRLAVRNVRRRPAEAALVVGGSLLGAALITGSLVVGDTLDESIRATAETQLGPVDEVVETSSAKRAARIERAIRSMDDERIDGVVSFVSLDAAIASDASGKRRAEPRAQLRELDFGQARAFGSDPEATGIRGPTPGPSEVAITEDLGETLQAERGDQVSAFVYGRELELEVARVLPRRGLAGFWLGLESVSPNAFVRPGTVSRVAGSGLPEGALPPTATIAVSNRGDSITGAGLSDEVTEVLERTLGDEKSRVEEVKQERLDTAEAQGDQFSQFFLNIGSFAILAGVLLLVNIFVMLAEERKTQLGMLRAVGLTRADLVRMFVLEGAIYALLSSALGAALGMGVGWAIVRLAAPIFGGAGEFSLDLAFSLQPGSVVAGFALGLLISIATVAVTSVRISRINVIRAIRDLPEPSVDRTRLRNVVIGTLVALAAGSAFVATMGNDDAFLIAILCPPLCAFALVPLVGSVFSRRRALLAAACLSLVWGVFGNALTDGQFFDSGEMLAFVLQGVLLTFSAVVLLSQTAEAFEAGLRRVAARRLTLRLGLAYPLARRFRTGLTLGMYALVIFTMTFVAVLATVFGSQIDNATRQEAGGFDVLVRASLTDPPSPTDIASIAGVRRVATMVHAPVLFRPRGFDEPESWPVTGVDDVFMRVGPPSLSERASGFSSDEAVWKELLSNPRTAVVDITFLQQGADIPQLPVQPGDSMEVIDPLTGRVVDRKVIGVTESGLSLSGVFMKRSSVEQLLAGRVTANRFYLTADGSRSYAEVTAELQGRFVRNGVEAQSFRAIVEENQRISVQFLQLIQSYLALGLVVGVAGLGVVMIRAVRERRREIGVLRSLGFVSEQVRRAFVIESGASAVQGVLVGSALALVTAAQLINSGDFGEGVRFVVPWTDVGLLCAIALIASLLATAWPAHEASKIPPAVALRIAE